MIYDTDVKDYHYVKFTMASCKSSDMWHFNVISIFLVRTLRTNIGVAMTARWDREH